MTRRPPLPKRPGRTDPADDRKAVGYVSRVPELDIDARIKLVARTLLGANAPDPGEPSEEDLRMFDDEPEQDAIITPHQVRDMVSEEPPPDDVASFLQTLPPETLAELREALTLTGEGESPADATGAGQSPAQTARDAPV